VKKAEYLPTWRRSIISPNDCLRDAVKAITDSGALMACVTNSSTQLKGIITDSDIRHALLNGAELSDPISPWFQKAPIVAMENSDREQLLLLAEEKSVREIPLIDSKSRLKDIFIVLVNQERLPTKKIATIPEAPYPKVPNAMLILAGGLGTRLRSIVNDRPKPLAQIGNKPILETLINCAESAGITNFYVAVNYMADKVIDHLKSKRYEHLRIKIVEEPKRLGTAGALGLIRQEISHSLLVCNADVLTTVPLQRILLHHEKEQSDITCTVRPHKVCIPYGVVELKDNRVSVIKEKPETIHLVNTGIYVVSPDICKNVEPNQYLDMPDLVGKLMHRKKVVPFFIHEYWADIGQPQDYHEANNVYSEHFGVEL